MIKNILNFSLLGKTNVSFSPVPSQKEGKGGTESVATLYSPVLLHFPSSSTVILDSTLLLSRCSIYLWISCQFIYSIPFEPGDSVCMHRFAAYSSSLVVLDPGGSCRLNDAEISFSVEPTFLHQYQTDNNSGENI